MNGISQFEAIHGAGQLDVSEQQIDVRPGLQQHQSIFGIDRFKRSKTGALDDINCAHSQEHLVFDDKDSGLYGGGPGDRRRHLQMEQMRKPVPVARLVCVVGSSFRFIPLTLNKSLICCLRPGCTYDCGRTLRIRRSEAPNYRCSGLALSTG
jgi:hypothetical protein